MYHSMYTLLYTLGGHRDEWIGNGPRWGGGGCHDAVGEIAFGNVCEREIDEVIVKVV